MKADRFIISLLFIFALSPALLAAEGVNSFFENNSARSVFNKDIKENSSDGFGYFRKRKERAAASNIEQQAVSYTPPQTNLTRDELIQKFGKPTDPVPLLGRDDAPKPFKAMMHAFEAGETDLAQEYAKQFSDYLMKVEERNSQIMGVVRDTIAEKKMTEEQKLKQAAQEKELAMREQVRKALSYKITPDPKGEVDIYFVFKTDDEVSMLMVPEVTEVFRDIVESDDPRVNFIGLSLDKVADETARSQLMQEKKISFPVMGGDVLARELSVQRTPAFIVVPRNVPNRKLVESGYRRFFYLDEVVKAARGVK
ncbi:MAG: hypothetical protein H6619_04745 [Deltaproteobacteria bacterium]|nr:hypothetical protein [Deltaproteobacteria bacterium]